MVFRIVGVVEVDVVAKELTADWLMAELCNALASAQVT
jgi:hypothetical protein